VVVSAQCGILSWENLNRSLFQIRDGEALSDTLKRVLGHDRALLEWKLRLGREAAAEINRRNLEHWLSVLCDDEPHGLEHAPA
jgi:hypothetical protein